MTLYVDSSALIKRYVEEYECDSAEAILLADPEWVTAGITSRMNRSIGSRLTADPDGSAGTAPAPFARFQNAVTGGGRPAP